MVETKDVINLTGLHVKAGAWVFPPHHHQKGIPVASITDAIRQEAAGDDARLAIVDSDEDENETLLLVMPDYEDDE